MSGFEPVALEENERVYMLVLPDEPEKVAAAQRVESPIGIGGSRQTETSSRHDDFLCRFRGRCCLP